MLFNSPNKQSLPLAEICRPKEMDDLLGQESIWSHDSPLYRLVENNSFHALLFWGPPGTGKTSLAKIISEKSNSTASYLSAVSTTVKEIRAIIEQSSERVKFGENPFILFVDEIHRLNKGQQDVLLPAIESGNIKFIGATTENPGFEVNKAILSRCLTFRFEAITRSSLVKLLERALSTYNETHSSNYRVSTDAYEQIASMSLGDARYALNLLNTGLSAVTDDSEPELTADILEKIGIDTPLGHDKKGDSHYDLASALIKSIRASHPDASLYYLARLIEGGEDPSFIARRLLISASEDIGNANPTALTIATNAVQAVKMLGMPEARIALSQLTTYLACSPKSNAAYKAIDHAISVVRKTGSLPVPKHLTNAPTEFQRSQGNSLGYVYPHDSVEYKKLRYLPDQLSGAKFYIPKDIGVEGKFKHTLATQRPEVD